MLNSSVASPLLAVSGDLRQKGDPKCLLHWGRSPLWTWQKRVACLAIHPSCLEHFPARTGRGRRRPP
eukprot:8767396-Alexandrium_andersonii.AAC.1